MDFTEYQMKAVKTAVYPAIGKGFVYPTLGLVGEAGEVAEKVKKLFRDKGGEVTPEWKEMIAHELGDVLWYLSAISFELGIPLEQVADMNIKKLSDRKERDMIHGSGDKR